MSWTLARRAARLEPSTIREILKVTERPGIISLAGGLPSADAFPVAAMAEASARVLREQPREALQYAASEGYAPLREWVAAELAAQGLRVQASQVLITTGSQQGLDLAGKVLVDPGCTVAVEAPTYLGALQAFSPYEPEFTAVAGDEQGPLPEALDAVQGARFLYLLPNFQNPSGRCLPAARRLALADRLLTLGLPVVEDNPYGDLWFDTPPPPPLAATLGDSALYLGSFSKVLAPGLRLGYVVAPPALYPKLLQAKQAADLHTPGFNQRVVYEVVRDGFLAQHVPTVRQRYKAQRDAMQVALLQHLPPGCRWEVPAGGMFFWVELPPQMDAAALLPQAVQAGVAYVPGAAFFAGGGRANTLRLSFVTVPPLRITEGVAALGRVLAAAQQAGRPSGEVL
ncbi:aminotransferase-like domain-containing protein [Pseudorhodoferax sp.]|uniref:aminotransferase-like domain-containing protein n=1 Tax=Pseudorhodoferax sp. TaxID=1993553 RepID=UPI002DD62948|nr:PLP-dependent aminotransferase family protein [Pseudorhodoferax sp.]